MNTHKTSKGLSFYARATSLGNAQRINANKSRNRPLADEFIRPMWISPDKKKQCDK